MTYESWRITYQSSEQAARAAYGMAAKNQRDAERYRWLRDHAIDFPYEKEFPSPWCVFGTNAENDFRPIEREELDAAVDAAAIAMNGANA